MPQKTNGVRLQVQNQASVRAHRVLLQCSMCVCARACACACVFFSRAHGGAWLALQPIPCRDNGSCRERTPAGPAAAPWHSTPMRAAQSVKAEFSHSPSACGAVDHVSTSVAMALCSPFLSLSPPTARIKKKTHSALLLFQQQIPPRKKNTASRQTSAERDVQRSLDKKNNGSPHSCFYRAAEENTHTHTQIMLRLNYKESRNAKWRRQTRKGKEKRKGFTLLSAWTAGRESRLRRDSRLTGRREHVKQTALQDKQKSVFNFARSDPSHVGAKHGRGLVGRGGWVLVPLGQSRSRINLSAVEWKIPSKFGAPLFEWPHWWSDMFAFTQHNASLCPRT